MGISDIWEMGRQGMQANRQAMQTSSNNIANANAPGYSRQKALISTRADRVGGISQGGVEMRGVARVHDTFVQKQIVDESHGLGDYRARSQALTRVENLFAKEGKELGDLMTGFFNDMRELSANPEASTVREVAWSSVKALTQGFHRANDALDGMRHDLDLRIEDGVREVNRMAKELAEINLAITRAESRSEAPNELYDRRDLLLKDLGQKVDFQTSVDQFGQTMVIAGGHALVQGTEHSELFVMRSPENGEKAAGSTDIFVKAPNGSSRMATKSITSGELGGMIHVRDKVVSRLVDDLDKLAWQFSGAVNEVHQQGYGMDGASGRMLFKDLGESEKGASRRFEIHEDVLNHREAIAAAMTPDTPGDNQIALRIADLQNLKLQSTAQGETEHRTFNESITGLVGRVGVETQRENNFFRHQQAVMDQLENYRDAVSGVSLEEEAINLMQYQTVFNASAKAFKVGEDLMDTILALKR